MQYKRMLYLALFVTLLALPLSFAAAQDDPQPITLPEVDALSVTGDIAVAGSSTVEPVTVAMAALFGELGYAGNIAVAETGTSAGFERFCKEGSTDLSNASRPIKDSEIADCEAIGRDVLEFKLGIDAVTVAVNQNSPVEQLKRSDLVRIFSGEVTTWDQINPDWPAQEIQLFTPGVDSGTFDFFGEAVLGTKGAYETREARFDALLAPNPTTSESDYTLVEGIRGSDYGIGYFGFAYYLENEDTLKAVAIADDVTNDDEGNLVVIPEDQWEAEGISYVAPSEETAESGEYMLSRPLFIYSAKNIFAEKPQVAAFVSFYLTNAPDVVAQVGYFPISVEALNASKQLWLDATGQTAE